MVRKKVFVCDDDADIIDMLDIVLSAHFETICETDSRRVIDQVHLLKPDVVIVDLWMPFIAGDEIIRMLRGDEKTQDLTIIAISASPSGNENAKAAGADLFIPKPFEIAQLIEAVRSASHEN
ncbi:MAG: response regulator [Citrobacter freundii]|nr:MAG: response regulator [Citrobacter freundii]